jgi:hypothetical protein
MLAAAAAASSERARDGLAFAACAASPYYFLISPAGAQRAKLLTRDEVRRIAAKSPPIADAAE